MVNRGDRAVSEPHVRPLKVADLSQIAAIHTAAFPSSALSRLGVGAVRRYYEWLLTGPHDALIVGCDVDGALAGFLFGGRFSGAMTGFLERNVAYLSARVLARPAVWREAHIRERARAAVRLLRVARRRARSADHRGSTASRPRAEPMFVEQRAPSFGVLVIAVDPSFQRRGVGSELMAAACEEARGRGAARMHLTVELGNSGAIAFYERLGWECTGDPFTGSMEYRLGPDERS